MQRNSRMKRKVRKKDTIEHEARINDGREV